MGRRRNSMCDKPKKRSIHHHHIIITNALPKQQESWSREVTNWQQILRARERERVGCCVGSACDLRPTGTTWRFLLGLKSFTPIGSLSFSLSLSLLSCVFFSLFFGVLLVCIFILSQIFWQLVSKRQKSVENWFVFSLQTDTPCSQLHSPNNMIPISLSLSLSHLFFLEFWN